MIANNTPRTQFHVFEGDDVRVKHVQAGKTLPKDRAAPAVNPDHLDWIVTRCHKDCHGGISSSQSRFAVGSILAAKLLQCKRLRRWGT
jgi:hypothetical protein